MAENQLDRRGFLVNTVVASTCAPLGMSLEEKALAATSSTARSQPKAAASPKGMPTGKIGDVTISRVICGGNLIAGYAHARDLIYVSDLLKGYFTPEKIFDTLELCEENGINTLITHFTGRPRDNRVSDLLGRYWRERGGEMQWIAQCVPDPKNVRAIVNKAIDIGACGCFLMGGMGDKWTRGKRVDLIAQTVEGIREQGVIAGVAGHSLQVIKACEAANLEVDFYVKTFHHDQYWSATPKEHREDFIVDQGRSRDHNKDHDNIWCIKPEEPRAFMSKVKKPWIAYKVLAAGAIHPREGLKYAFDNGADFILAGMFDFQVTEDAIIASKVIKESKKRERPWYA